MVIDTHNHTQTCCMLESWHIQHHQSPLNRERGTLPGLYAALLAWPYIHLTSSHYCVITISNICFPLLSRLVSYLLHCTQLYPIVMSIPSPPPPFPLFYLGYITSLVKLTHFLTCCIRIYTSRDNIVWLPYCIYTCVPVSVNNSLMKAAVGCQNVWITDSVFWLVQRIDRITLHYIIVLYITIVYCNLHCIDHVTMVTGIYSMILVTVVTPAILSHCSLPSWSRDLNVMCSIHTLWLQRNPVIL